MALPAVFKPIKPFLARAEELDKDASREESKVVAYFCRQFAMEKGLELRAQDSSPASTEFLTGLMAQLEMDKGRLVATPSKEEGKAIVARFALDVFARADQEDRAELADKGTARTFYAAGIFLEVLKQFGELEPELEQKKMYAKWKSAEILKALKAGVPVTPGGPGEPPQPGAAGANAALGAAEPGSAPPAFPALVPPPDDVPAAPTVTPVAPAATPTLPTTNPETPPPSYGTNNASPAPTPVYPTPAPTPVYPTPASRPAEMGGVANGGATPAQINDAIELAKFAIRSLEHKQVGLGVERLQQALAVLQHTR